MSPLPEPHVVHHVSTTEDGDGNIATGTVHCTCGERFTADVARAAYAAHQHHAEAAIASLCQCNPPMVMATSKHCGHCGLLRRECADPMQRAKQQIGSAIAMAEGLAGLDPTRRPDVREYPAMATNMDPTQFKAWLAAPGRLYLVYLPGNKAFPIKVPDEQHAFFVAILTQLRIHLGDAVQAQSAQPVDAPPPQQTPPSPATPPNFIAPAPVRPPERYEVHRHTCPGAGQKPKPNSIRGREKAASGAVMCAGRGECAYCGTEYKLTNAGRVRLHREMG